MTIVVKNWPGNAGDVRHVDSFPEHRSSTVKIGSNKPWLLITVRSPGSVASMWSKTIKGMQADSRGPKASSYSLCLSHLPLVGHLLQISRPEKLAKLSTSCCILLCFAFKLWILSPFCYVWQEQQERGQVAGEMQTRVGFIHHYSVVWTLQTSHTIPSFHWLISHLNT